MRERRGLASEPSVRSYSPSVSCAPRLIRTTGRGRSGPGIRSDVAVSSGFPPREPRVPLGFPSFDLEVEERREQQEEQACADEPGDWLIHIMSPPRSVASCAMTLLLQQRRHRRAWYCSALAAAFDRPRSRFDRLRDCQRLRERSRTCMAATAFSPHSLTHRTERAICLLPSRWRLRANPPLPKL